MFPPMPEIEFDPVDAVTAGAVGRPGERVFYLHATKESAALTVKLEKEQAAVLALRLGALLEEAGVELTDQEPAGLAPPLEGDVDPLFPVTAVGIGYDPGREVVVIELHERPVTEEGEEIVEDDDVGVEAYVARLVLTTEQARGMAARALAAVAAGRAVCPLCKLPMDPDGHACPARNGHKTAGDA
jgi:uncharacterized repeat protein (TIGR03847 family)